MGKFSIELKLALSDRLARLIHCPGLDACARAASASGLADGGIFGIRTLSQALSTNGLRYIRHHAARINRSMIADRNASAKRVTGFPARNALEDAQSSGHWSLDLSLSEVNSSFA